MLNTDSISKTNGPGDDDISADLTSNYEITRTYTLILAYKHV